MKIRKDGKLYDTDAARFIAQHEGESLYTKKTGECFFTKGSEFLGPADASEARAWVSEKLEGLEKSDALMKLPRRSAGEARYTMTSYLTEQDKKRVEALRLERGFENADIMLAGVEALEMGMGVNESEEY